MEPEHAEPDVATRITAARLLRGLTRDELTETLVSLGMSVRLANRLQRGTQPGPLLEVHRIALSRALRLPERWFTAPVDELFGEDPDDAVVVQLDEIRRKLQELRESLA